MKTSNQYIARRAKHACLRALGIVLTAWLAICAQAISPNTLESFENGTGNWVGVNKSAIELVKCRPDTSGNCLRSTAKGFKNTHEWAGDYFESGISGIEIDVRESEPSFLARLLGRFGQKKGPVPLRIGISDVTTDTCFVSKKPAGSFFSNETGLRFSLEEKDMARVPCDDNSTKSTQSYRETLSKVSELRIFVGKSESWKPNGRSGDLILDSVRVIANTGTQWRFIGLKNSPDANCPVAPGDWTTGHLFGSTNEPLMVGLNTKLTRELRRYCVMELAGDKKATAEETAKVTRLIGRGLTLAQPDQVAVMPGSLVAKTAVEPRSNTPLIAANDEAPADAVKRHAVDYATLRGMGTRFASYAGRPDRKRPYERRNTHEAVKLVVLDTAGEFSQYSQSTSAHGQTVARAAASLACPGKASEYDKPDFFDCPIYIKPAVALAFRPSTCGTDIQLSNPKSKPKCHSKEHGGSTGMIGELAETVARETRGWRDTDLAAVAQVALTAGPLVINGSIGWNAIYGGSEANPADMPLAARSVYHSLEDARCAGALLVFASGNLMTGPTNISGPAYPGAWVRHAPPNEDRCKQLAMHKKLMVSGLRDSQLTSPKVWWPVRPITDMRLRWPGLVVAVGAVGADLDPVANSVPRSEPRFVAYGDSLALYDHDQSSSEKPSPYPALTGTSASTIVVSTTMAVAWHYLDDKKTADDVERTVYSLSKNLDRNEQLGNSQFPYGVRFVRLCDVINGILPAGSIEELGYSEACPRPRTPPELSPGYIDELLSTCVDPGSGARVNCSADIPTIDFSNNGILTCDHSPSECGGREICYFGDQEPDGDACPHLKYYSTAFRSTTDPAPEDIPCPTCTGSSASPGKIHIAIDPDWGKFGPDSLELKLSGMTLNCDETSYYLGEHPALDPSNGRLLLENVPEPCTDSKVMHLSFRVDSPWPNSIFDEPRSVINPIFRVRDSDRDGIINVEDNCQCTPNESQKDDDQNGIGDACGVKDDTFCL